MIGIMDHRPKRYQKGLKESKRDQKSPEKEVVNPWAL